MKYVLRFIEKKRNSSKNGSRVERVHHRGKIMKRKGSGEGGFTIKGR
jgi:hypothetical protein